MKLSNIISIATGVSEETILSVKSQIRNKFNPNIVSSEEERNFLYDKTLSYMSLLFSVEEAINTPIEDIVSYIFECYIYNNMVEMLQLINRVFVQFYGYKLGDPVSFYNSLIRFSKDFFRYIEKECSN